MPSTTLDQILGKNSAPLKSTVAKSEPTVNDGAASTVTAAAPTTTTAVQNNPAAPTTTQSLTEINTDLQKANTSTPRPPKENHSWKTRTDASAITTNAKPLTAGPGKIEAPSLGTNITPQEKTSTYRSMYEYLNPNPQPSEEELEKERKKEKRQKLFSAIGDGISALSNLYFTTQYAPSTYSPDTNMTKQVEDRWDKIKKERDEKLKSYMDGLMRAQAYDDKADALRQEAARKAEKDKAEKERKEAIIEAQRGKYEAAARKDAGMAAYYDAKAKALNAGMPKEAALLDAKIAKVQAEADRAKRQGTSSWVSGKSGGGKSSSGPSAGQYRAYDRNGKEHWFKKKEDGKAFALQEGTWVEDHTTSRVTRDDGYGGVTTTDTRKAVNGRSVKPKPPTTTTKKPEAKTSSKKNNSYTNTKKLGL